MMVGLESNGNKLNVNVKINCAVLPFSGGQFTLESVGLFRFIVSFCY